MAAAGDSISDADGEHAGEFKRKRDSHIVINQIPPTASTWSMVSIKDKHEGGEEEDSFSHIFPPINHENLHLAPPLPTLPDLIFKHPGKPLTPTPPSLPSSLSSEILDDDESNDDSSTSTLFSPSTGPDSPPVLRASKKASVARWTNLGMEVLSSKLKGMLLLGTYSIPTKASALAAATMVVVGFLYFRWRRRRGRMERDGRDQLVRIIRQKDERINQLLNQIARMNEVLLALQRLPVASKTRQY